MAGEALDALIVGGGVAGLALARRLEAAGRDWLLVEARDRFGGRALSQAVPGGDVGARYDLGPAWFWPGQPRMAALLRELGLRATAQHDAGRLVLEEGDGAIRRDLDFAPMAGALRIAGGAGALAEALAGATPEGRARLSAPLAGLRDSGDAVEARLACGEVLRARHVALAVPARVLAATVDFGEGLDARGRAALRATPTWMAGHAKFVAVYARPFWREAGLSGSAISRRGPLVEIHDCSGEGGEGALFGFVGAPAEARAAAPEALRAACLAQLARLFGEQAGAPLGALLKDWAQDAWTATAEDRAAIAPGHPSVAPARLGGGWGGRVLLCASETAPGAPGLLEGALEAAEAAARAIEGR